MHYAHVFKFNIEYFFSHYATIFLYFNQIQKIKRLGRGKEKKTNRKKRGLVDNHVPGTLKGIQQVRVNGNKIKYIHIINDVINLIFLYSVNTAHLGSCVVCLFIRVRNNFHFRIHKGK